MANYAKIRRDAVLRRRVLQSELARAKKSVKGCQQEIGVLDQIIGALKGVDGGVRAGRPGRPGRGGRVTRATGRWRPGRPGRPPNWWLEQQKAKRGGKRKRRGRRTGRRGRKPAAAAPAPAATPVG